MLGWEMVKWGIRVARKAAAGQLDMFGSAIVTNDDIESYSEMWRMPVNIGKKAMHKQIAMTHREGKTTYHPCFH